MGPDDLPLLNNCAGVACADGGEDHGEVVAGEEEDVGCEMEGRVEEGVEADEAAEANEEGDLRREAAQRRDGQAGQQCVDGPVASEVGDVVDGVGVECERAGGIEVNERG